MSDAAAGMLAVWTNVAPAQEADFNAWYTREHVADRVGVPGFRTGARYEALNGDPRYLALYDTDSVDVLYSPAYLKCLNEPTPWTQRVMPSFRDTIRATCRMIAAAGHGVGGMVRTYRVEPVPGQADALRGMLAGDLTRRLIEQRGVVRARVVEGVVRQVAGQTAETAMRGPDRMLHFGLLVDGEDRAALEASGALVDAALMGTGGAVAVPPAVGNYRLIFYFAK